MIAWKGLVYAAKLLSDNFDETEKLKGADESSSYEILGNISGDRRDRCKTKLLDCLSKFSNAAEVNAVQNGNHISTARKVRLDVYAMLGSVQGAAYMGSSRCPYGYE